MHERRRGHQGKDGPQGKDGRKSLLWCGNILISDVKKNILTFPYNGTEYSLSKLNYVVDGNGKLSISIKDSISGNIIFEGDQNIGGKSKVNVFSKSNFKNLPKDYSAIVISMKKSNSTDNVEVLSIEISM